MSPWCGVVVGVVVVTEPSVYATGLACVVLGRGSWVLVGLSPVSYSVVGLSIARVLFGPGVVPSRSSGVVGCPGYMRGVPTR